MINTPRIHRLDQLLDEFFLPAKEVSSKPVNTISPPVRIYEYKDYYLIELLVPGRKKEQIDIQLDRHLLTIKGEGESNNLVEDVKQTRKEFGLTAFRRSFTIDEKIDTERIDANYEDGILKLKLFKKEDVGVVNKKINIL